MSCARKKLVETRTRKTEKLRGALRASRALERFAKDARLVRSHLFLVARRVAFLGVAIRKHVAHVDETAAFRACEGDPAIDCGFELAYVAGKSAFTSAARAPNVSASSPREMRSVNASARSATSSRLSRSAGMRIVRTHNL